MTIRQIAAREFHEGLEFAASEQALWDVMPTLPVGDVERIVRCASDRRDRFALLSAAVKGQSSERIAALKARFTPEELKAMVSDR